MGTLGKAVIEFSADTAKFVGDVGRAAAVFEKGMGQMQRGIMSIRNAFIAAAGLGGIGLFLKSAIDGADQLNKLSQRTGLTTERLSEMKFAASLSGVAFEDLGTAIAKFNQNLVLANDGSSKMGRLFRELGVDLNRGPQVALNQFLSSIAGLSDAEVRVAALREVMGRAGDRLVPFVLGLKESSEQARALGVVIGPEFARQAEQFNDDLKRIKSTTEVLAISISSALIGGLSALTGNLARAAQEGRIFKQMLNEIVLLGAALAGRLARFLSLPEGFAEKAFSALGSEGAGAMGGPARGKIRRPGDREEQQDLEGRLDRLRQILSSSDQKILAEQKRFLAARQALEMEIGRLNALSAVDEMKYKVIEGSLKDLTEAHKVELLNLAVEVDLRRQLIDRLDKEYASRIELEEIKKQAEQAATTFFREQRQGILDEEFRTLLLGKTAFEMQKLTKLREIDRAALEAVRQVDAKRFPELVTQIYAAAEVLKTQWIEALDAARAKQLDWHTGVVGALNDYRERVADMASQARDFVTGTFQTMEDKLVEFTTKGKLDFKGFVDSAIADLARLMIRRNITGPLAELSGGLFGSLFSGLFGAGTQAPVPVVDVGTPMGGIPGGHQGGIAGKLPRLHAGGLVGDETLAVLRRGEGVFTPEQMQALGPAGPTFFVDLRGASVDAVARLERFVASLHGSIESRAVAAVRDARARGR